MGSASCKSPVKPLLETGTHSESLVIDPVYRAQFSPSQWIPPHYHPMDNNTPSWYSNHDPSSSPLFAKKQIASKINRNSRMNLKLAMNSCVLVLNNAMKLQIQTSTVEEPLVSSLPKKETMTFSTTGFSNVDEISGIFGMNSPSQNSFHNKHFSQQGLSSSPRKKNDLKRISLEKFEGIELQPVEEESVQEEPPEKEGKLLPKSRAEISQQDFSQPKLNDAMVENKSKIEHLEIQLNALNRNSNDEIPIMEVLRKRSADPGCLCSGGSSPVQKIFGYNPSFWNLENQELTPVFCSSAVKKLNSKSRARCSTNEYTKPKEKVIVETKSKDDISPSNKTVSSGRLCPHFTKNLNHFPTTKS